MSVASLHLPSVRQYEAHQAPKQPHRMTGRVLVADDSSDGRRMIAGILGCLGLEVAVAENGRVACDTALAAAKRGQPFDLVLMDSHMPVLDGYEATALLRSKGYTGRVIALISESAYFGRFGKTDDAGFDGLASKPITFEMLNGVVRRYLPQARHAVRKVSA